MAKVLPGSTSRSARKKKNFFKPKVSSNNGKFISYNRNKEKKVSSSAVYFLSFKREKRIGHFSNSENVPAALLLKYFRDLLEIISESVQENKFQLSMLIHSTMHVMTVGLY